MASSHSDDRPLMQRLYDNVWLLAVAAIAFFALSYVAWGVADIISTSPV